MRSLTRDDCRILLAAVKAKQLGPQGDAVYARLFQEAFGVPLAMVQLLARRNLTIHELTRHLQMSRRTVFRYLLAIEGCGCTIELDGDGYHLRRLGPQLAGIVK